MWPRFPTAGSQAGSCPGAPTADVGPGSQARCPASPRSSAGCPAAPVTPYRLLCSALPAGESLVELQLASLVLPLNSPPVLHQTSSLLGAQGLQVADTAKTP